MYDEALNRKDRNGRTLLHRSLYQNKQEIITDLLTTPGIDVNIKTDVGGCTPLYYACEKNNSSAVKMLLSHPDIEVNLPNKNGFPPIMAAASFCSREALEVMVADHRVNLDRSLKTNNGEKLDEMVGDKRGTRIQQTEIFEMINKSRKLRAKEEMTLSKLLQNVSDKKALNERDENGRNLLHRSLLQNNRKAIINLLSTPGIDVNLKNNCGSSPLAYACVKNNIEAVKLLLAAPDVDVNTRDIYDRTPIMVALKSQSRESVKLLLDDYRVDLGDRIKNNDESEPEDWISGTSAAKMRYLDMIKKARKGRTKENQTVANLLENRYDAKALNENGESGWNFLHRSLNLNHRETTVALLCCSPGIDVNAGTTVGDITPLIYACEYNNTLAVKLLLEAPGILVNKPDRNGKTPIMTALAWCSRESLKLLVNDLRVDLDQRIKSKGGRTLDECIGFYSKDRGYGEYGETVRQDCLNILDGARKNRASVSELRKKVEEMEIQKVESQATIQKTLECPVCRENMKPPTKIWMCSLSHIVCEPCKNRLEENLCPECRTKRVTLRAFMAEHFAEAVFN